MKEYYATFYTSGQMDVIIFADSLEEAVSKAKAGDYEISYAGVDGEGPWELGEVYEA